MTVVTGAMKQRHGSIPSVMGSAWLHCCAVSVYDQISWTPAGFISFRDPGGSGYGYRRTRAFDSIDVCDAECEVYILAQMSGCEDSWANPR